MECRSGSPHWAQWISAAVVEVLASEVVLIVHMMMILFGCLRDCGMNG